MPVDYSLPTQIQTPNLLGAMGNLVNTAQGIQAFQSGQIQQQRLGINLQSEAQANQERKNVIAAMQAGDPALSPDDMGIIDPAKSQARLQQLAPQTWSLYTGNIQTSNKNNIGINNDLRALGQDTLKGLGEAVQANNGKDASEVVGGIKDWMDAHSKEPLAQKVGNTLISSYGKVDPANQSAVNGITLSASKRANAMLEQITASAPEVGMVGQGAQVQPVVINPRLSGQSLMAPIGQPIPMGAAPAYQIDAAGNLVQVPAIRPGGIGAPINRGAATSNAGNLPAPPAWMNKQQAQNAADAQARWSFAQNKDVDPNAGYQPTAQVYKNLHNLLEQNPNLGPGSAGANQFIGRISTLTKQAIPDLNTAYQETASYLDRLGSQNAVATGAANKFQDEQAARATGSPEMMGPPAIHEKLRFGASVNEAAHAYAKASQAFLTKQGPNAAYANPQLFEGAWSANASPIAFRLMADQKNGDTEDFKATAARATAADHQAYLNLRDYLLKGLLPPQ